MNYEMLSKLDYLDYDEFIQSNNATFYHSSKHLEFLKKILNSELKFIVASDSKIRGILPLMIKHSKYGDVVNSLPFFGSYGGMISTERDIEKGILNILNKYNKENQVLSSVIISNPFNSKEKIYNEFYHFQHCEERLIQYLKLENKSNENIWQSFEQRTRRAIRKAKKDSVEITKNINKDELDIFYELHKKDIESKGGVAKQKDFFLNLNNYFKKGEDYEIFLAKQNEPIAFLLVFYFHPFTEYYMPAYKSDFRNTQSTSLLIWESIKESITKNMKYYNFGGTCKNQKELYKFKKGWNTEDLHYKYYIYRDIEKLKKIGINDIKKLFPNFFVTSYSELQIDKEDKNFNSIEYNSN